MTLIDIWVSLTVGGALGWVVGKCWVWLQTHNAKRGQP